MKNKLLIIHLFVLIFANIQFYAQEIPVVKVKETSVILQDLNIKVEVNGNIASTTYDMTYYNPNERVLEGELLFPLGQGQNVTRFALDLNGKLREAVVVEKELGRVAFENTIKQKIDPALLEKTTGNNYKARIYPIPAKGTKRVVISYDQELIIQNNAHFIYIPLKFKEKLKNFKLEITVFKQAVKPIIEDGDVEGLVFDNWNENFVAKYEKRDYIANSPLKIKIPISPELEKVQTYADYFYIYKALNPKTRLKSKPNTITILWDASLSLKNRKIEKELEILNDYFSYLSDVTIKLIKFNNELLSEQKFNIRNGNWESLKKKLTETSYDGGTSFKNLNFNKKTDEFLLFTDGIENLGDFSEFGKTPVYVINSVTKANHNNLEQLCNTTGGNYINLNNINVELAYKLLINETYRFLGVKSENKILNNTYPNSITNITNDFSVAGKGFKNGDKITLLFGFGTKADKEVGILLNKKDSTSKKVKFIWAQKKLKSLSAEKEKNKKEIIRLSKKHQIISPFTSLIVLDRIEDYVRYKIEPPADLVAEYNKKLAIANENEIDRKSMLNDLKNELFEDYSNLAIWWGTEFKYKKEVTKKRKTTDNNASTQRIDSITTINSEIDRSLPIISGVISDSQGPLPGVNIMVKNSNSGVQTDFDGRYALNAEEGAVLIYSFLGMNTVEKQVAEENIINIEMEEDAASLDEVVVTGYGTVEVVEDSEAIVQLLSGTVSGVSVSSSVVAIRGSSSITNLNKPLYVIDGVIQNNEVELSSLDIEEMFVLKSEQSTAVFGAKATAGVIVIKTKQGVENNLDKILEMEELIDDNIELKPWEPDAEYLKVLRKEKSIEDAYSKYLQLRNEYFNVPSFYMDMADFFDKREARDKSLRILTNLTEIELDNYELLKVLAYKLEEYKRYDLAINIYKEILKLRPEDIQSYRDLALCYKEIGEYQEAVELLFQIVNGELLEKDADRSSEGIESIAFVELNNLISRYSNKLNLNAIDKKFIKHMPMDIRVVIDWNHNDTDIDLWVTDPNQEKCFYKHVKTKIGGRISEDMTDGFGPESFILKKAINGVYKIAINYYADDKQKISGPTFLKVTVFKNYSTKRETKSTMIYRLDKGEDELEVGKIKFNK